MVSGNKRQSVTQQSEGFERSGGDDSLKRDLKSRHIQLIALGYAIAGVMAFFIMRQLGEMIVDEPVAGSFSYFADKYWVTRRASSPARTTGPCISSSAWRSCRRSALSLMQYWLQY